MTLKAWALKVGELRPLDPGALLLFGARCALRVARWSPPRASKPWSSALDLVLAAAAGEVVAAGRMRTAARDLASIGAIACDQRHRTKDEALGRCMNYATGTLVSVLDAAQASDLAARKKELLVAAKQSASIPALLARADAVAGAATTAWGAIRADIPIVAGVPSGRRLTPATLEALGPLWPDGEPSLS